MGSIRRVCVIYDDRDRPETTGGYCLRALQELTEAVHFRPDALATVSTSEFDLVLRVDDGLEYAIPSTFRPLAWWAIDTHLNLDRCLDQARRADLTFAAQKPGAEALRRAGIEQVEWLPLACDPGIHRPHSLPKVYDVCFVGNQFPGDGNRTELLERLRREYPNHFVGRAFFDEMAQVYSQSRTSFNCSVRDDLNMRVFEALACGSLLVTNSLSVESGQNQLFRDGTHLAEYREPEELFDKLRYYHTRPELRTRLERKGREEVIQHHTYRHRMERILEAASRIPRLVAMSQNSGSEKPNFDPSYFEFERPELLALVPREARDVVDVGCGAGRLGEALKRRQDCQVVGIEHNPIAAAAARTRLDLVVEGDAEQLNWSFPPHSFDAVICGDVLEHLRDPLPFLRKVHDWLRPTGVVIVSLPNVRHHSVLRGLLAGDWTYEPAGLLDHTHLRFFTRREAEKLFFRAGFEIPAFTPVPGPGFPEWDAAGRPGEVNVGGLRIGPLDPCEAMEFYTYQWLAAVRVGRPKEPSLTSIVILTHNQLPLTRQCLDSIRLVTDEPYELILVDNGSTDGTPEYLKTLAVSDSRVTVLLNAENRGFPAGCNQGIAASTGQHVLLLNNDTVVTTGWLTRLLQPMESDPRVGLTGPCSNRVSGEQRIPVTYSERTLEGLDGFAWEWARSHYQITEETDRLVGFCLLIRRCVLDSVGVLDEGYGMGNFEDDDYCLRAMQAGFKLMIARDAFVHHIGGATFTAVGVDYAELLRCNGERFQARWGTPPENSRSTSLVARELTHAEASDSADSQFSNTPGSKGPLPGFTPRTANGGESSKRAEYAAPSSTQFTLRAAPGRGLLLEPVKLVVSGCLIVRDNAKTIRPCLESLRPWVDELIVVDTGSHDDTPTIAAELGARIFHFPWIDDFSAARNESLKHARGEWIFWMDSDDTIDANNGKGLRDLVRGGHAPNVLGYVMGVHCPGSRGGDDLTIVDHLKLFRNRPDLRFEHRIHEQIIPAIRRAGGDVAWTDLFVVHTGYDHSPEGQVKKKERDLRILRQELTEWPQHPFTLFNLGMTYADIGEPEKAIGYFQQSLAHSEVGASQRRKAFALLAHCQLATGDVSEALNVCESGLAECPEDRELQFRLGVLLHHAGRLQESVRAYQRVLSGQRERYFSSMDPGITGFKARGNMALVLAELGEWDQAEAAWRAVTKEVPHYRPGWRGLGELLTRRGKLDEATTLARTLIENPQLAIEGHILLGRAASARGQTVDTRYAWERATSIDPTDPEPLQLLGKLYFEAGDDRAAERVLQSLAQLLPDDAATHHNLGTLQLRNDRATEATGAFRKSLELRPDSLGTRVCLGYALQSVGDRNGAADAWRAVLRVDPDYREAADALRTLE